MQSFLVHLSTLKVVVEVQRNRLKWIETRAMLAIHQSLLYPRTAWLKQEEVLLIQRNH